MSRFTREMFGDKTTRARARADRLETRQAGTARYRERLAEIDARQQVPQEARGAAGGTVEGSAPPAAPRAQGDPGARLWRLLRITATLELASATIQLWLLLVPVLVFLAVVGFVVWLAVT